MKKGVKKRKKKRLNNNLSRNKIVFLVLAIIIIIGVFAGGFFAGRATGYASWFNYEPLAKEDIETNPETIDKTINSYQLTANSEEDENVGFGGRFYPKYWGAGTYLGFGGRFYPRPWGQGSYLKEKKPTIIESILESLGGVTGSAIIDSPSNYLWSTVLKNLFES